MQFQLLPILLHSKRNNQKLKLNKMKETIYTFSKEFQIELTYTHKVNGRGSYIINIDVMYEVDRIIYVNRFEEFTTDSKMIDEINDLRSDDASHEDIQSRYHQTIFDYTIQERIKEWIDTLIIF